MIKFSGGWAIVAKIWMWFDDFRSWREYKQMRKKFIKGVKNGL